MRNTLLMSTLALAFAVAGTAFAQSTTGATNPPSPNAPTAECRPTAECKSAVRFDRREAQARPAKGRILRGQGPARRLLDPGQDQRRQPHIDDPGPKWSECTGSVERERYYDRPSSIGQQSVEQQSGSSAREALADRSERAAIPLSHRQAITAPVLDLRPSAMRSTRGVWR